MNYIIGCGGVGSALTPSFCLLKSPAEVTLIDGDTIETRNLDRQMFDARQVGLNKAQALATRYGYTVGRPNSGGTQLKHKFVATLSAMVTKVNPQRSVEIQLFGSDRWVTCGNVVIPTNHKVPHVGQVVEVRYLYAFRESGVLYQPVYLGQRNDVDDSECLTSQLKFKAEEAE